jgi:GWxTD domain-containing protein
MIRERRRAPVRSAFAVALLAVCLAACGARIPVDLDPESRDFYDKTRRVMTSAEEEIFLHLPDLEERRIFMKEFWERRDPDPDTEQNEFREELDRRLEYITKRFREGGKGINTDRGRIYFYLGPPDKAEEYMEPPESGRVGPILAWTYYRYDVGVLFYDVLGDATYTIQEIIGDLSTALEMARLGETFTGGRAPSKYVSFDLIYDLEKKEFRLTIPLRGLSFQETGDLLRAEFDFSFSIYIDNGTFKDRFAETRVLEGKAEELEKMKTAAFTFSRALPPGKAYVDVILATRNGEVRSRKIFNFRIG